MEQRFRRGFTAAEKTELWDRWQRGESLKAAGWLKRAHPDDESYSVSHETIYRSLFVQARGVLKKELLSHLRSKRTIRRSKQAGLNGDGRGQIKDLVSIRERPAAVEDRAVRGHWEGDLLAGSKNSYIATLVERHTRYVMLAKVPNKDTQTVVSALIKQAKKLPSELYKSLTWDRGKELTDHRRLTLETNIDVYFCDPQSPWQRGVEREHQWSAEAVLSEGHRPVGALTSPSEQSSPSAQRTATRDLAIRNTSREIQCLCCVDQLRRQPEGDTRLASTNW
jgi:hypothetical protein